MLSYQHSTRRATTGNISYQCQVLEMPYPCHRNVNQQLHYGAVPHRAAIQRHPTPQRAMASHRIAARRGHATSAIEFDTEFSTTTPVAMTRHGGNSSYTLGGSGSRAGYSYILIDIVNPKSEHDSTRRSSIHCTDTSDTFWKCKLYCTSLFGTVPILMLPAERPKRWG